MFHKRCQQQLGAPVLQRTCLQHCRGGAGCNLAASKHDMPAEQFLRTGKAAATSHSLPQQPPSTSPTARVPYMI